MSNHNFIIPVTPSQITRLRQSWPELQESGTFSKKGVTFQYAFHPAQGIADAFVEFTITHKSFFAKMASDEEIEHQVREQFSQYAAVEPSTPPPPPDLPPAA